MKNFYIIFLINFLLNKNLFKNQYFCKHLCSSKIKKQKYLSFNLKGKVFKTKILKKEDFCIKECEIHFLKKRNLSSDDEQEKIEKERKNYCVNGLTDLDDVTYLKEFHKGPCNPIVIVPGVLGSRLEFVITDCDTFRNNYKEINENCDFDCENKTIYNLWMPDYFSEMSMYATSESYIKCFVDLMSVIYKKDEKSNEYKLDYKPGLNIRVKGISKENGKDSNCGVDATQNYTGYEHIIIPLKETLGFHDFTIFLKNIGYRIGLTLQHLPYDFRLSYRENDLNDLFQQNIQWLSYLNNKKVIIIAHSLGTLNSLYQLKMNEEKELYKKIGNFISVTPPFFGSNNTIFDIWNLFSSFFIDLGLIEFGINRSLNEKLIESTKSIYELMPPNPERFINEDWFKWVNNRIMHENLKDELSYKLEGVNLLPNVNDLCYSKSENKNCEYELQNYFKPVVKFYNGKIINLNNINKEIKNFTSNQKIIDLVHSTEKNDLFEYNPKVQQTFIFVNSINTKEGVEYKEDISEKLKEGKEYINPNKIYYRRGDGTVPTFSVLFKAIKQAYEFKKENNKLFKPVKILELCSLNKRLNYTNFYDEYDVNLNQYIFNKNSYNGIECGCENDLEKNDCLHSRVFLDKKLHNSIFKLIQLGERKSNKQYEIFLKEKKITNDYLKEFSEEVCVQLKSTRFGYKENNN